MNLSSIAFEFVEHVPREIEDGVLYISTRYRTAVHRCACGCGNKVVTPIRPTDWKLSFDGDTISLMPSIGNWQFPCRSHYWISHNRVRWSGDWTDAQIAAGRRRDRQDRERYFTEQSEGATEREKKDASCKTPARKSDWFSNLKNMVAHLARTPSGSNQR